LNELLLKSLAEVDDPQIYCWPPLLANERQVSGILSVAMSQVCPVSRPEYAITRSTLRIEGAEESAQKSRGGRVDFLASYGNRDIAFELKRAAISSIGSAEDKKGLLSQWETVRVQSKEALRHMRDKIPVYEHPISIGLLVIRVSRKVTSKREAEVVRQREAEGMPLIVDTITKLTRADFVAHYVPPKEMQTIIGWGENEDEFRVFPGIVFAGVVHGSTK
jgi:hypothetical protein